MSDAPRDNYVLPGEHPKPQAVLDAEAFREGIQALVQDDIDNEMARVHYDLQPLLGKDPETLTQYQRMLRITARAFLQCMHLKANRIP